MFGKLGDMMGKIKEMKARAEEVKEKLNSTIISEEGAGGDIKVTVNGNRIIQSLHIAPGIQYAQGNLLQEELHKTLNKALEKANALFEEEMKKAAAGLIPGM